MLVEVPDLCNADLAAARADLSSLLQQIGAVTSLMEKTANEANHRWSMHNKHALMLQALKVRAN